MRARFTARHRLRRTTDFAAVRAGGQKILCGPFIMQVLMPTGIGTSETGRRLGVIASRHVGAAVKRNRAKRLIRECFRSGRESLPARCDVVVVIRRSIDRYAFKELHTRFLHGCQRIRREAASAR